VDGRWLDKKRRAHAALLFAKELLDEIVKDIRQRKTKTGNYRGIAEHFRFANIAAFGLSLSVLCGSRFWFP
jgi:hypothetical protein